MYFFMPKRTELTPLDVPIFKFAVLPGETVYLGEFFMSVSCALDDRIVIRDAYDRDVALAIKQDPEFARRPVTRRLMTFERSLHYDH
jgi:hypothetical protein